MTRLRDALKQANVRKSDPVSDFLTSVYASVAKNVNTANQEELLEAISPSLRGLEAHVSAVDAKIDTLAMRVEGIEKTPQKTIQEAPQKTIEKTVERVVEKERPKVVKPLYDKNGLIKSVKSDNITYRVERDDKGHIVQLSRRDN